MKTFEFVAFDSSGKKKAGLINARGLSEAKRKIQQNGLYLASIRIRDDIAGYGVSLTKSGIKGGNTHSQNSFSFLKELKRFFFLRQ